MSTKLVMLGYWNVVTPFHGFMTAQSEFAACAIYSDAQLQMIASKFECVVHDFQAQKTMVAAL